MSYKPSRMESWKEYLLDWCKYFGFFYKKQIWLNSENSTILILDAIEIYSDLFKTNNINAINKLLDDAKLHNIPVVYTNWIRRRNLINDQINKIGHWSEFVPEQSKILHELPKPINTIYTIYTDAFAESWDKQNNKKIENQLIHLLGTRKNLIICGSWTEACVLNTARSAANKNINPVILKPGTVGHSSSAKNALISIDKLYGYVTHDIQFS